MSKPVTERHDLGDEVVALTFDDGPAEWTLHILDVLRDAGAVATFFVVGDSIPGREATLLRIHAEGHELGNHGLTHVPLDTLGRADLRRELERTTDLIKAAAGTAPTAFRPPYFRFNRAVLEVAAELGFAWTVNASVFASDWLLESAQEISGEILSDVQAGSIVLLHDGRPPHDPPHSAGKSRDDRWPTVEAVRTIVPALIERGFQLVTVSDLLQSPGA